MRFPSFVIIAARNYAADIHLPLTKSQSSGVHRREYYFIAEKSVPASNKMGVTGVVVTVNLCGNQMGAY